MKKDTKTATVARTASSGSFISGNARPQEQAAITRVADYLRNNPMKLRQLAVEMGIHTKTGRLTKAYGG